MWGNSWFKAQNVLFAPGGQHPDHTSSDLVGDGGGVGGASNGGAGGLNTTINGTMIPHAKLVTNNILLCLSFDK